MSAINHYINNLSLSSSDDDEFAQYVDSSSFSSSRQTDYYTRATKLLIQATPHIINHCKQQNPRRRSEYTREYIDRKREQFVVLLDNDYFVKRPTWGAVKFRRRFRMQRPLFLRIVEALEQYDPYFQQRRDATGRLGFTAKQKCTSAIRQLAYCVCADMVDEYTRVSQTTGQEALKAFCDGVVAVFGPTYMRRANAEDVRQLVEVNTSRGFPGMLGSIDCMHWEWKNCPSGWKGQFQGKNKRATLVLEAVASQDTWIWHAFFGVSRKLNDRTIVERSPVFDELLRGKAPAVNFEVNGNQYDMGYYLTDGIYPMWATFVKSIKGPINPKQVKFAMRQEACRKDVERAFGVLQARFKVIKDPALAHTQEDLARIMNCCICLHNMIVEDERHLYRNYKDVIAEFNDDVVELGIHNDELNAYTRRDFYINQMDGYLSKRAGLESKETHLQLQEDIMNHV